MSLIHDIIVEQSTVPGVVHITPVARAVNEDEPTRVDPIFADEDSEDDWADPCFTFTRDVYDDMIEEEVAAEAAAERDLLDDSWDDLDWDDEDDLFPSPRPNGSSRLERIRARRWDAERELDEDFFCDYDHDAEQIQDSLDVRESARERSNRIWGRRRSDQRWAKSVGWKEVRAKPSEVYRCPVYSRNGEACAKADERLREQKAQRSRAITSWLDGRKIFRNPHGWLYWCHLTNRMKRVSTPMGFVDVIMQGYRQGERLTVEEFRFFDALSHDEQRGCLHEKCEPDPVEKEYRHPRRVSRSNSWKHQRRQTRQWESPHMRQGHAKKVAESSCTDEQSTFERELEDRLRVLRIRLEIIQAEFPWTYETLKKMREVSRDIELLKDALWNYSEVRRDMEEIFWRLRNRGEIPMEMLQRIAEKRGHNVLVNFLMVAGLSSEEAYQREAKVCERIEARRVA